MEPANPGHGVAWDTTTPTMLASELFARHFTVPGEDPYETVAWTRRDARAGDFFQADVEAPERWSDTAVAIVSKLYFATIDGVRESSVRQLVGRVVGKIVSEARAAHYFETQEE